MEPTIRSACSPRTVSAWSAFLMPFLPLFTGIRHLTHVLIVPPTKAWLLCATPAGTYRVQSLGFPKIVYYALYNSGGTELLFWTPAFVQLTKYNHSCSFVPSVRPFGPLCICASFVYLCVLCLFVCPLFICAPFVYLCALCVFVCPLCICVSFVYLSFVYLCVLCVFVCPLV